MKLLQFVSEDFSTGCVAAFLWIFMTATFVNSEGHNGGSNSLPFVQSDSDEQPVVNSNKNSDKAAFTIAHYSLLWGFYAKPSGVEKLRLIVATKFELVEKQAKPEKCFVQP